MFLIQIKKIVNFSLKGGYLIGELISLVYIFRFSVYLRELKIKIYSGWLSKQFKECGENLYILPYIYGNGLKYISVGKNFISGSNLRIEAFNRFNNKKYSPQIIIGDNVNINFDCHIGCIDEIKIGNNVLIASKVLIIDHFHGESTLEALKKVPIKRDLISKGKIVIGENVWIGEGCVIMPGVIIGDNCIVGANSVVTKKFGSNLVIGGNPAKIIKEL